MKRNTHRGFSLAEVLVATAVLVTVVVAVLMLYDRANRAFKQSTESAEMQQNVRVAYDRMIADIRMAGFDYKRGGPMLPGQSAAAWAPNRAYSSGTIVTPTVPNGRTYRAINAGTTGGAEPGWPGAGLSVVEVGATPPITWQENGGATYEQPDEQVEYAGATALTIRGNFDYSVDPTADDHGREPGLETSQFPVVTTGNDEIVTYALVSNKAPQGTAPNTQSITMFLDLVGSTTPGRNAHPGGAAEESTTISGIDLTNNNPPYTLYRFTFENNGTPRATPLADNIRSLNFFYYSDPTGQSPLRNAAGALAPNIGGGGQYDPANAASANHPDRLVRRTIRSIRVRLVGMNPQSDSKFNDTSTAVGMYSSTSTAGVPTFVADTVAPNYRRIAVDTLIVPRNLGMTGLPQTFLTPPPKPTVDSICNGYCGIVVVNWNPNTNNPNAQYAVMWDTDPTGSYSHVLNAGTSNTFAVDLTQEDLTQTFYFKVRATNAGGSATSANYLAASGVNATKPNGPNTIVATGGAALAVPSKVVVTWQAPVTNASGSPSCTSGPPSVNTFLREIQSFRVYRGTTINFNAASGNMIANEIDPRITSDGYGNYRFEDDTVACGQAYYYRVQTVEYCAANAGYNSTGLAATGESDYAPINSSNAIKGQSGTSGTPQAPVNLTVVPNPTSICDPATNQCTVVLNWSKVTTDTTGAAVAIDEYEIEREIYDGSTGLLTTCPMCTPAILTNTQTFPLTGALAISGSTVGFTDKPPHHDPLTFVNFEYKYRVRAMQTAPCPDGNFSTKVSFPPPCTFTGSVIVQAGASAGNGLSPGTAWVMNTGDTITIDPPGGTTFSNTTMLIVDAGGTPIGSTNSTTTPAAFAWANLTPGDIYTVTFTMTNTAVPPCTEQKVRYIQQEPLPACSLTTFATQSSILAFTATNYQLKLDLVNAATESLTLDEITFDWAQPNRIVWNSIAFPSTNTVALGGSPAPNFTVDLTPNGPASRPANLTAADVTVPCTGGSAPCTVNGTRSLLLNFAKTNANPPSPPPSTISNICVSYRRPSITVPVTLPAIAISTLTSIAPTVIPISTLTSSGTTATATTSSPHGLVTGSTVTIAGAAPVAYNGTQTITVTGASTFTYLFGGGTSPAAGAITVTPPTTATATTSSPHGLATGSTVTIAGATPAAYNGNRTITATGVSTFTYTFAGGASPATGTITATPTTVPFLFRCNIKPDQNPSNPNTCQ